MYCSSLSLALSLSKNRKMGRGRAPCCDKTKVRTGPWSPAEDLRLMNFIQSNGHSNWRALPKQAGLLRCGKSCRLRWINYLRPDVKRGNFTAEEENTIIQLHTSFGNKWSKIASCLPGRTDNEIKNVWNTHLKKRLQKGGAADHNPQKNDGESSTILEEKACTEFDGDFWDLLESLDPLQPQVGADDADLQGKVEAGRWLRFLENELGLANDVPQIPKFIQPTAICRPTSPAHHYLGI